MTEDEPEDEERETPRTEYEDLLQAHIVQKGDFDDDDDDSALGDIHHG